MTGNSGTSKTYFCAAVYQHLHDEAYGSCVYPDVRYFREIDVYDNVKKSFDTENGSQSEKIRNLIDHQFLIIDDVASQSPTDWQKSMFFDLVDLRYKSGKPTIFTSNLTYSQFHQIYDQRTCSRLFAAENTIVDVSGDDLRKQGM